MKIFTLNQCDVSIISGKSNIGTDIHKLYENNPVGRTAIAIEQPPEIVAEVMTVWGNEPTMLDPEPTSPQPDTPLSPSLDQRTAALEAAMLAMMGGAANV